MENRNEFLHGNNRYIRGWFLSEQRYATDVSTVRQKISFISVALKNC